MTRDQAEAEAKRLMEEHPERTTHRWFARSKRGEEWEVVRVRMPPGKKLDPLKVSIQAKPKPSPSDDPRPSTWRDLGGPHVGGG